MVPARHTAPNTYPSRTAATTCVVSQMVSRVTTSAAVDEPASPPAPDPAPAPAPAPAPDEPAAAGAPSPPSCASAAVGSSSVCSSFADGTAHTRTLGSPPADTSSAGNDGVWAQHDTKLRRTTCVRGSLGGRRDRGWVNVRSVAEAVRLDFVAVGQVRQSDLLVPVTADHELVAHRRLLPRSHGHSGMLSGGAACARAQHGHHHPLAPHAHSP